jgi:GT2 family glycosyltransferase
MPNAVLIVNPAGLGSVASRAAMMERARGDLVLALDDDSYPEQYDCLALLAERFALKERLAIATFPQRSDEYPASLTQQDFGPARSIRSFPNSGACLRVSSYRQLSGFEPMFFHMYEEPDYALQCVANGWEVRYFPDITIRHHWTPNQRSEIRNHHRHARNELWSTLMRCPFPQAFGMLMYRVVSQARFAASRGIGWLVREPLWWFAALRGLPQALCRRRPVTWTGYRKWLSLPDG